MGPMGHSFDFVVFVFAHVTTTLLGRQGRLSRSTCVVPHGLHQRSFQMHALRIGTMERWSQTQLSSHSNGKEVST